MLMLPADVVNQHACMHAVLNGACNLRELSLDLWFVYLFSLSGRHLGSSWAQKILTFRGFGARLRYCSSGFGVGFGENGGVFWGLVGAYELGIRQRGDEIGGKSVEGRFVLKIGSAGVRFGSPIFNRLAAARYEMKGIGWTAAVTCLSIAAKMEETDTPFTVNLQCQSLPRGQFAEKASSHSYTVFARDMVEVFYAEKWEGFIETAGFVFMGEWTPESVGDYASGTNHFFPTYGYARKCRRLCQRYKPCPS
ncbi:hypothetical protein QQ045_026669 [Rhodiola kirilowii]